MRTPHALANYTRVKLDEQMFRTDGLRWGGLPLFRRNSRSLGSVGSLNWATSPRSFTAKQHYAAYTISSPQHGHAWSSRVGPLFLIENLPIPSTVLNDHRGGCRRYPQLHKSLISLKASKIAAWVLRAAIASPIRKTRNVPSALSAAICAPPIANAS